MKNLESGAGDEDDTLKSDVSVPRGTADDDSKRRGDPKIKEWEDGKQIVATSSGGRDESPDSLQWHGTMAIVGWKKPKCVARSDEENRPGYQSMEASEYMDARETLKAKVQILAEMIKSSERCCVYTGAGISTASGIGDYASKAKGSRAMQQMHKNARGKRANRLELRPTYSHHLISACERKGYVKHWLQQNHDRLSQKAGFPQAKLNEIHGAWQDKKNRVLMMDEELRPDLLQWMGRWERHADLCIAMGTSLCGMTADCVAEACARRGQLVIINLQKTAMDSQASLRLWGLLDDVLAELAKALKLKVPNKRCVAKGKQWERDHPKLYYSTPKRKETDPM